MGETMNKYICLLFVLLSGFSGKLLAQEKETTSPLSFNISIIKFSDTKPLMTLNMRITNTSSRKMVIDRGSLFYKFSILKNYGIFSRLGEKGSNEKGKFIVLLPKKSYVEKRDISLEGLDFVNSDGKYILTLTYGYFSNASFKRLKVWRGAVESNGECFYREDNEFFVTLGATNLSEKQECNSESSDSDKISN